MDEKLAARLDELIDRVTTTSPNHLDDWREIQREVLDQIRDEGHTAPIEEFVEHFKAWGMMQGDIPELRRRLRRTFGW